LVFLIRPVTIGFLGRGMSMNHAVAMHLVQNMGLQTHGPYIIGVKTVIAKEDIKAMAFDSFSFAYKLIPNNQKNPRD
jgi:hypothetical protein